MENASLNTWKKFEFMKETNERSPGSVAIKDHNHPQASRGRVNEPSHEVMVLSVLRKLILQTRMRSHPVGLDV